MKKILGFVALFSLLTTTSFGACQESYYKKIHGKYPADKVARVSSMVGAALGTPIIGVTEYDFVRMGGPHTATIIGVWSAIIAVPLVVAGVALLVKHVQKTHDKHVLRALWYASYLSTGEFAVKPEHKKYKDFLKKSEKGFQKIFKRVKRKVPTLDRLAFAARINIDNSLDHFCTDGQWKKKIATRREIIKHYRLILP